MNRNKTHLGQVALEGTAASQNVTGIPAGTTTVDIFARDGDVYVTINGVAGPGLSGIYLGDTEHVTVGPYEDLRSIQFFAAGSVWAHFNFSSERLP